MNAELLNVKALEIKSMNFREVKFGPRNSNKPTDGVHTFSWDRLRAGASVDNYDAESRKMFVELLKEAETYASFKKVVRVYAKNLNGHCLDLGAYTWAAVIEGMGGVSLRGVPQTHARKAVGRSFGDTGKKSMAEAEVKEAVEKLKEAGFTVSK